MLDLSSCGGDLPELERLIATLRRIKETHRLDTRVGRGATCASACVPVFLQGQDRWGALTSSWLFHEVGHWADREGQTIAALGVTDPIATLAFFAAGTGLVLTFTRRRRASEAARTTALEASVRADQAWQALVIAWQAQRVVPDFTGKRREIEALKARIDALALERAARIKAVARIVPEGEQRAQYLAQFRIEDAGLYNVGAARCAGCARGASRPPPKLTSPGSRKFPASAQFDRSTRRVARWARA